MQTAVHTLIYSDDPAATRAFFRDVLELPFVTDGEGGEDPQAWLIFASGPSEIAVQPTSDDFGDDMVRAPRHHQMSLMVTDIEATTAEIRERGGIPRGLPTDLGFGIGVEVDVPGTDPILIYQPRHATTTRG
ncbi:VOC family protein [Actinomycetota bacterium]